MKRLFLVLILFSSVSVFGQSAADSAKRTDLPLNGISVYPSKLSFSLNKGENGIQSITISNATQKKQSMVLEFQDWQRDTIGEHIFFPPGTSQQSCANWLTFDRPFVELEPGQTAKVTVTIKIPNDDAAVSEMKWTMLIVKAIPEKRAPNPAAKVQTVVERTMGIGVHIYQTPPNIANKELKMISFAQLNGKNDYRVICRNQGGVQLYSKFSLELASEKGEKTSLTSKTIPLFPKQVRYVDFNLPASLPKGKYTAIALIDAGDDDVPIEAAQKEIIIK